MKYEAIKKYLDNYPEEPPYDFNGILQLVLVGIENLEKNHMDSDLEQFASALSQDHINFLNKLIEYSQRAKAKE